jgi:hypothetical protein
MQTIQHSINGVPGILTIAAQPGARAPGCFYTQKWISNFRPVSGWGVGGEMRVEIRYDDECRNGHNSFAITASIYTASSRRKNDIEAGGCMHEEIAKFFPELASLNQLHLFDAHAPMHYIANTLYHATDWADSRFEPGTPCEWETRARFGNFPITFVFSKRFRDYLKSRIIPRIIQGVVFERATPENAESFEPVAVPYVKRAGRSDYDFGPHYTVTGDECKEWHEAPFKSLGEAQEFCQALNAYELTFEKIPTKYAGTKERNLKAARECANWPEATDEQLCAPRAELQKALEARLPDMMARFRAAIENECGFQYEAPEGLNV